MKHLREFVTSVPEYRRTGKGNFKHKLEDILMLVILGRLSKCITKPRYSSLANVSYMDN